MAVAAGLRPLVLVARPGGIHWVAVVLVVVSLATGRRSEAVARSASYRKDAEALRCQVRMRLTEQLGPNYWYDGLATARMIPGWRRWRPQD